jgi:cell division protein FtsL
MTTMIVSFTLWIFMRYTRHELLSQLEKKSWELYRASAEAERARLKEQTKRKLNKVKSMARARKSHK